MKHLLLTTIAAVLLVGTAFADPIHDAARNGDHAGVQAQLDAGADVNAKLKDGTTPLHEGEYNGHKEVVELLITSGADVNAMKIDGMTPLDMATFGNHNEIAGVLRKHGGKTGEELKAEGK